LIIECIQLDGIALRVRVRGEVEGPDEVHSIDVLKKSVNRKINTA
jgi:hypothetical protein